MWVRDAEVPDDAWVDGRLERLDKTIRLYGGRPNSPTVAAFLHFDSDSAIRVGSHVTLGHSASEWCVLAARHDHFELIRDEPERPTKVSVSRSDIRQHLHKPWPVFRLPLADSFFPVCTSGRATPFPTRLRLSHCGGAETPRLAPETPRLAPLG